MQSNTCTEIFSPNISFNIDDIKSKSEWRERAYAEAKLIYNKPSTRKNRTIEQINEVCLYGHAAEQYLLETGYDDDERPYKDLIDPELDPVEIKCTEHKGNVPYVLERCVEAKLETWRKYPNIVYIFINNRKSKEYIHEGVYYWVENSKRYRKVEWLFNTPKKNLN